MPELPEVELVARSLHALISGRLIKSARLLREKLVPGMPAGEFEYTLAGALISRIHRRGKHILIDLGNGYTLIVHLRMSGRFSIISEADGEGKFAHAIFYLADGEKVVFYDQRHFGMMKLVRSPVLLEAKELAKLAPEPFSESFSVGYLARLTASSGRSLKEFLLDQTKVCGLGNIYACEAMFMARVSPMILTGSLSRVRLKRLFVSIREVLRAAVDQSSACVVDPRNIDGRYFSGSEDSGWLVYGREGEPCSRCTRPILRVKQGGRSTYFCLNCQR